MTMATAITLYIIIITTIKKMKATKRMPESLSLSLSLSLFLFLFLRGTYVLHS